MPCLPCPHCDASKNQLFPPPLGDRGLRELPLFFIESLVFQSNYAASFRLVVALISLEKKKANKNKLFIPGFLRPSLQLGPSVISPTFTPSMTPLITLANIPLMCLQSNTSSCHSQVIRIYVLFLFCVFCF